MFVWNSLGQLVQVQSDPAFIVGGPTVTFGYDAWGRRVRKTSTANGVTTTTYFVWDGDDLAADLTAAGDATAVYTYYPGAADQPFSVAVRGTPGTQMSSQTYYYVTEPPGHVTGLVDATGAPAAQYAYGAFGPGFTQAVRGAPNGWVNRLQFGAREYDAETGLYYNRARYYDPSLQRFISRDPSGLAGGVNWYAYAGNDPVNATDPTGLDYSCTNYGGGGYVGYAGATSANAAYSWSGRFPNDWVCSGMDATPGGSAAGPIASNWEAFQMYANAHSGGGSGRAAPAAPPPNNYVGGGPEALLGAGRLLTPAQSVLEGLGYAALLAVDAPEEGGLLLGEVIEGHHIFPQAFASRFRGIVDIDEHIMQLPRSVHRSLHGWRGGPWNAAWREFFRRTPSFDAADVYRYGQELIERFGISGPMTRY